MSVDLELSVTLDPTNPQQLLATITAQAERLRRRGAIFTAKNRVMVRSDYCPDYNHHIPPILFLRGDVLKEDGSPFPIPLPDWPKIVDALWEAHDAKVLTFNLTLDGAAQRAIGPDAFGYHRRPLWRKDDDASVAQPPAPALTFGGNSERRDRAADHVRALERDLRASHVPPAPATSGRTCEYACDSVDGRTACGRSAKYLVGGGKWAWCGKEGWGKASWIKDGTAVPLYAAPATAAMTTTTRVKLTVAPDGPRGFKSAAYRLAGEPESAVAPPTSTPLDPLAAKRAKLEGLVAVPVAMVVGRHGLLPDDDLTFRRKAFTYTEPWSRRLCAFVSPVGLPLEARKVWLTWALDGRETLRPRWTWFRPDAKEYEVADQFAPFSAHIAARDLDRLIERLQADPLCGEA